jgi:HD superfamily phosphodiesterase
MKILQLGVLINSAFNYVINTSNFYAIDESHALKHSMEVFHLTNKIYESEITKNPFLEEQKDIIYASSILHDMCDKKYMDEKEGLVKINYFMKDFMTDTKLDILTKIVSTMSYSKVKINGFPTLDEYQLAYHIVREADLLSAYDVDRCIIYSMMVEKLNYINSIKRTIGIFENRVLKYRSDNLFVTGYSKNLSRTLHHKALKDLDNLKKIIENQDTC